MSTQVLNLPLTRQAYKAVEEGERIVSLPNTHHTLRKLYQPDGLLTPKPYKRVNIRLGASGKPTQFEIERIGWRKRGETLEHYIKLGRQIVELDDEHWTRFMFMVLQSLALSQLEIVRASAACERIDGFKKFNREVDELLRYTNHHLQYNARELMEQVTEERTLLSVYISKERDDIFRRFLGYITPVNEGASSPHHKSEAFLLELYCLLLKRLYAHNNNPKVLSRAINTGTGEVLKIAMSYSEGQGIIPEIMNEMVERLFARILAYRQYSTVI